MAPATAAQAPAANRASYAWATARTKFTHGRPYTRSHVGRNFLKRPDNNSFIARACYGWRAKTILIQSTLLRRCVKSACNLKIVSRGDSGALPADKRERGGVGNLRA